MTEAQGLQSGGPHGIKPMISLKLPLAFCGLVALLGYLGNHVHVFFSILFIFSCILLPLMAAKTATGSLRHVVLLRKEGWVLSLIFACLYVAGPFLFLWAVMRWFLQALFLNPGLDVFIRLMAKGMIAFLPVAVAEEFFFRGYLQETVFFGRWCDRCIGPFYYRNLLASALFALTHVAALLSPIKAFPFTPGMIFGRLVIQSRSNIWPAVALHAFANAANEWLLILYRMNLPWM